MPDDKIDETKENAQQVRVYCDTCAISFPNETDEKFRNALQKHLARKWGLASLRNLTMDMPVSPRVQPSSPMPTAPLRVAAPAKK